MAVIHVLHYVTNGDFFPNREKAFLINLKCAYQVTVVSNWSLFPPSLPRKSKIVS